MPELLSFHRVLLLGAGMMMVACGDPADPTPGRPGQLLFTGREAGVTSLYVVDDTGGTPQPLVTDAAFGRWSPDGREVVFQRSLLESDGEIIVRNIQTGVETNLSQHPASDWCPDWSPSGRQIVFVSGREGGDRLYVVDRDGSGLTPLGVAGTCPVWSPDGKWIAFSYHHLPDELWSPVLAIIRPDGSDLRRLTDSQSYELDPTWTLDGTQLLFCRSVPRENHESTYQLVRINLDGTGATVLASHSDSAFTSTAVGPQGEIILTAADYGFRGNYRLFRMASDGSNRLPAGITFEGDQFYPDWHWSAD
jgi:Tol biopolymer transport system component